MKKENSHITIEDIANLAGVAKSTVSRVINNSGAVSQKTRDKVMAVIDAHQFVPNVMASDLGRQLTSSIGIFIGDISNQYYTEILAGLESAVSAYDYFPFICLAINEKRESFYVQEMLRRRVSGVVVASTNIYDMSLFENLAQTTTVVTIQTDIPGTIKIDCTNEAGTFEMINTLISLGHQKIAYLDSSGENAVLEARKSGYLKALSAHNLPRVMAYEKTAAPFENGYHVTQALLALSERPTAIHAANDHLAAGAYLALRDAGLHIPEDISLSGFDGLQSSSLMSPPLSTVVQPIHEMGKTAITTLFSLLQEEAPQVSSPILFPTELLLRGSIAPPK
ncbi:MAG: LacI family DNA-binding transcriptional regulator [Christensenellaceae bacterium]|jgi:DNA-binding LacI/PurR family transcriptional regulator